MIRYALLDSPLGPLTLVADHDALAGLYQGEQKHLPDRASFGSRDDGALPAVQEQLEAYFAGALADFDVTLAERGTPFQREVWAALRRIPYGTTCTYGDLAGDIGRPSAVRAVGAANGRNPVGIIVPCHRVVGAGGALTGYAGGLANKLFLLDLEAGVPALPLG